MSEEKKVQAVVGQPVQIKLQSMVGSTGYGWYLARLDGGLALSSAIVTPTAPGVAPVNHQFDFMAVAAGPFKVEFQLLAPWRPGEAADTEVYEVDIAPPRKSAKEDIEASMAGRDFIKATSVNVGQAQTDPSTVLKYAAPMATATSMLDYAAPMTQAASLAVPQTCILYAVPMTRMSAQTLAAQRGTLAATTMIAYAAPVGPNTMALGAGYAAQSIDPCLQTLGMTQCPQPVYAAPMAIPTMVAPYAAPCTTIQSAPTMVQPYAAPWPNMQVLYAAPMAQGQSVQPLYAAPMTQNPQPLYAAPTTIMRYAAPYMPGCC
jgi:hypothetical protein